MKNVRITCNGKVYHSCKKDAVTAMNAIMRGRKQRRHGRPEHLNVYPCPRCHGWHLTHRE